MENKSKDLILIYINTLWNFVQYSDVTYISLLDEYITCLFYSLKPKKDKKTWSVFHSMTLIGEMLMFIYNITKLNKLLHSFLVPFFI